MKGGYQILEISAAAATGSAVIDGAYAKATAGKAILIEGYGATQFVPAGVAESGTVTIVLVGGDVVTIKDDNTVTITTGD